jgi:hypothetical protein
MWIHTAEGVSSTMSHPIWILRSWLELSAPNTWKLLRSVHQETNGHDLITRREHPSPNRSRRYKDPTARSHHFPDPITSLCHESNGQAVTLPSSSIPRPIRRSRKLRLLPSPSYTTSLSARRRGHRSPRIWPTRAPDSNSLGSREIDDSLNSIPHQILVDPECRTRYTVYRGGAMVGQCSRGFDYTIPQVARE